MSESPSERIARLERKNTLLSMTVFVLVLMLAGLAVVGWEWAESERLTAETKRLEAAHTLERASRVAASSSGAAASEGAPPAGAQDEPPMLSSEP